MTNDKASVTPHWVEAMAALERERRERYDIAKEAAHEFLILLMERIRCDLERYYKEFPRERHNIELRSLEEGGTQIIRTADERTRYVGVLPSVTFSVAIMEMAVACHFSHRQKSNKCFRLVLGEDGKIKLAEGDIADVSEYLLSPVLFDKLPALA